MLGLVIVVLILVGVAGFLISIYNRLIRQKNQIDNAFAQIDVQLKRRYDLIPNLVELAKSYLGHESETLMAITQARNLAQSISHTLDNADQMAQAEGKLSKALANFYAVAENYPNLKADVIIRQIMDELTNTENRIAFARQHYNDSVMFYNANREVFPNNLISGFFKFEHLPQLQFADKSDIDIAPKI